MTTNRLLEALAVNLTGVGLDPDDDVCLDIVIRFARNIQGEPFAWRAASPARQNIRKRLIDVLNLNFPGIGIFPYESLSNDEAALLLERNPSEIIRADREGGAFAISADGTWRFIINDLDHLRIFGRFRGRGIQNSFETVREIDMVLDGMLVWACDDRYGFLGPAVDDLGPRLRLGFHVFLPGIIASGVRDRVFDNLLKADFAVRPLFADDRGSDAGIDESWCPYFDLTASSRLGMDETELLARSATAVAELLEGERLTRRRLLESRSIIWKDRFSRAAALLQHSYLLTESEARSLIADLRFGIASGWISSDASDIGDKYQLLDELALSISAASLRLATVDKVANIGLNFPAETTADHETARLDWFRAALVRERLPHYHIR